MADFHSAATYVSAMLETSGYVAQQQILDSFASFFSSAGILFYLIAIIGALMSVAVFGSYRWGTYLLIAPVFFYYFVGVRADVGQVERKLGGGDAESIKDYYYGPAADFKPSGDTIRVAQFFSLYTTIIDGVVNSFVDFILQFENRDDLFVGVRSQVLEYFYNAPIQDEVLGAIVRNSLSGVCSGMMDVAVELAHPRFSDLKIEQLKAQRDHATGADRNVLDAAINLAETEKQALQKEFERQGKMPTVIRDRTFHDFIEQKAKAGTTLPTSNGSEAIDYTKIANEGQDAVLSCNQVWEVNKQAIMDHANWLVEKANVAFLKPPLGDTQENRDFLCRTLSQKIHGDKFLNTESGNCDLVEAVTVFLLRQTVLDQERSRALNVTKQNMRLIRTEHSLLRGDQMTDGDDALIQQYQGRPFETRFNDRNQLEVRDRAAEAAAQPNAALNDRNPIWRQAIDVTVEGQQDAAYGYQQRYASRALMQSVYSYAMNLPYWQGVILYLIAMIYPFVMMLALVPSRAMTIVYMPLTWFWVKSWDIGFALVIILDKILWNILPTIDMDVSPFTAGKANLSQALSAAMQVDPSYNVHLHRNFLSMALFAVPSITGYAILKGKSSILASFTDALQQSADDAGQLASGAVGMDIMNLQRQKKNQFSGQALEITGSWGEGFTGGGRMSEGTAAGLAAGVAKGIGVLGGMSWFGDDSKSTNPGRYESNLENILGDYKQKNGKAFQDLFTGTIDSGKFGNEVAKNARAARGDIDSLDKSIDAKKGDTLLSQGIKGVTDAVTTGIGSGFDFILAAQNADAQDAQVFHKYYGSLGKYSSMFRGIQAAVDGTGGFEIEEIVKAKDVVEADIGLAISGIGILQQGFINAMGGVGRFAKNGIEGAVKAKDAEATEAVKAAREAARKSNPDISNWALPKLPEPSPSLNWLGDAKLLPTGTAALEVGTAWADRSEVWDGEQPSKPFFDKVHVGPFDKDEKEEEEKEEPEDHHRKKPDHSIFSIVKGLSR